MKPGIVYTLRGEEGFTMKPGIEYMMRGEGGLQ